MSQSNDTTELHFAALVRVSTEKQEKTGESLRTQRKQIKDAVERLGGAIVEWYGGQEHATPGWEKGEVKRLLANAQKESRSWDAVIVSDADRWSRDNETSRKGLDLFKRLGIRFFTALKEWDLFQPADKFFLGVSAVVGEYQAAQQNWKSITNRIERAKRGWPTTGKLPFGRTWDRDKKEWGIDPQKKNLIEDAARRYLAGESIPDLADEYGMNASTLHKNLTKRCGDTWVQEFNSDELNIHEEVPTKVPRLLPEETIKAIHERVEANKTYSRGMIKNQYLLSGMVFCEHCGYALFGQENHGRLFYRHAHLKRVRKCAGPKQWPFADELEDAVLRHLFNVFGNPKAVEEAMQAAIPDQEEKRKQQERVKELDRLIEKETKARQRILHLVRKGDVTEDEASQELQAAKDAETRYQEERGRLAASLENVPTPEEVKRVGRRVSKAFVRANAAKDVANWNFDRMTWEEKRDLLQRVFAGKMPDGRRRGVYITWAEPEPGCKRRKVASYTIRGRLVQITGTLPMAQETAEHLADPDYAGAEEQERLVATSTLCSQAAAPRGCRSRRAPHGPGG